MLDTYERKKESTCSLIRFKGSFDDEPHSMVTLGEMRGRALCSYSSHGRKSPDRAAQELPPGTESQEAGALGAAMHCRRGIAPCTLTTLNIFWSSGHLAVPSYPVTGPREIRVGAEWPWNEGLGVWT